MSPLVTLQCRHGYFADGVCQALSLVPTAGCARLLARYQLRFQALPGGGIVHYEDGISPLAQFTESAPLAFWLISRDPALSDYTDIAGPRGAGLLFYFDNLQGEPATGEPDTGGSLADGPLAAPCLPARPPRFSVPVEPPRRAARLALFGAASGDGSPVWQARSPDALLAALPLDFGALDEGRYRLSADGTPLLDFWLGSPPAGAWGVVAIYPGGPRLVERVPAAACAIGRNGAISAKTYSIGLAARSLRWRYHLIGRSDMNLANYQLLANRAAGDPVHFDGAPGEPVDGRPSYCFTAREPLPLAQRPGDTVSVRLAPLPQARAPLGVNLAYPRPGNVSGTQDGQQFADVFVYL